MDFLFKLYFFSFFHFNWIFLMNNNLRKKKKRRRAWTPGRFCDATGALWLLPLKALAQNVLD